MQSLLNTLYKILTGRVRGRGSTSTNNNNNNNTCTLSSVKPVIVTDIHNCCKQVDILTKYCMEHNRVIGLDCEWTSQKNNTNPVALLQLAASNGHCLLIRLPYFTQIPPSLMFLLADPSILKVGVAVREDADKLLRDYSVFVDGVLDLRYLARLIGEEPRGLAVLAQRLLDEELDKDWRVSASNWDADVLTDQQIVYAAKDAYAGVKIFEKIAQSLGAYKKISMFDSRREYDWETLFEICDRFVNKSLTRKPTNTINKNGQTVRAKCKRIKLPMRSKPLYENCYMEANDGELLCTCSRQKAEWYLKKGLASLVNQNPFTIRLKFDPVGRAVGQVGKFYQVPHENMCVVCGEKNSYIRKNVIPVEYRKLFPPIMKDHSSHDVVLLCFNCHQSSNMKDHKMRCHLQEMCNAPINDENHPKFINNHNIKKVQSAANALLRHSQSYQIPQAKLDELKTTVLEFYEKDVLTDDLLENALKLSPSLINPSFKSHSQLVIEYFVQHNSEGLVALEELWRKHFISSMKPNHMPEYWSMHHGRERLRIKLQEGRIDESHLTNCGIKNIHF